MFKVSGRDIRTYFKIKNGIKTLCRRVQVILKEFYCVEYFFFLFLFHRARIIHQIQYRSRGEKHTFLLASTSISSTSIPSTSIQRVWLNWNGYSNEYFEYNIVTSTPSRISTSISIVYANEYFYIEYANNA